MLSALNATVLTHQSLSLLSLQQLQDYQQQGYLILEDFVAPDCCDLLIDRANHLMANFDPRTVYSVFSTQSNAHLQNQYFIDSADKISFFFEENAFNSSGDLRQSIPLSINKIGHALHDVDPLFNLFSRQHKWAMLAKDLNIVDPKIIQSMYICKQPFIGGEVNCHQDSTYLYVEGFPVIGFWLALQDATLANGCLWAIPGGHSSELKSRLRRTSEGLSMEKYAELDWDLTAMQPLEVKKGSVIVLHGLLPHMSKENLSGKSRHAYAMHIVSAQHTYPNDNWLQRSDDFPATGF